MNDILTTAVHALDDKKGDRIAVYDFRNINPYIQYVVIASASNQRQVWALADNVADSAKEHQMDVKAIEGNSESRWILVDLHDVIVHVFLEEERVHYGLEKLYADVPRLDVL